MIDFHTHLVQVEELLERDLGLGGGAPGLRRDDAAATAGNIRRPDGRSSPDVGGDPAARFRELGLRLKRVGRMMKDNSVALLELIGGAP